MYEGKRVAAYGGATCIFASNVNLYFINQFRSSAQISVDFCFST